jgi:hypothetical protein
MVVKSRLIKVRFWRPWEERGISFDMIRSILILATALQVKTNHSLEVQYCASCTSFFLAPTHHPSWSKA